MTKSHNKKSHQQRRQRIEAMYLQSKISEFFQNDQCQVTDIMYKCTVLSPNKPNKMYLGTAEGDFKKRFFNHRKSFNSKTCTNDTLV